MTIKNVTFGSDIEMFLQTLGGDLFPACGIIGGTKDKPRSVGGGYFVQEDNVLLEYNIPVTQTAKTFIQAVQGGFNKACAELPPSLKMSNISSCDFPEMYIRYIQQASEFGCDPDYNAWTQEQNPKPTMPDRPYFRSAAAHIHIGWDNPQPEDQLNLIKWADVHAGLYSVLESGDRSRRKLYGRAGSFRPKDYGVEHRVLDNYWIWSSELIANVFDRYLKAIDKVNRNVKIDNEDIPLIQKAINEYDLSLATNLIRKYKSK